MATSRPMIIQKTPLAGACIVDLQEHRDERGFFARTYCRREFEAYGLNPVVAQVNVAYSRRRGTLRGMHFQFPPHAETKLVRATRGRVVDVIVDLRPESPTYLRHFAVELSAENRRALYVPERFAHGYQTLEDDTEVVYQVGAFYAPQAEGGLSPFDEALGLRWPLAVSEMSVKDRRWPLLAEQRDRLQQDMALTELAQ
jgi:dTDP-4-dehydrorhamnose 3,5-epimerase